MSYRYQKRLQKIFGPCGCCYTWEPERARDRQAGKREIREQLTEVPDNVRVFDDFRELPDFVGGDDFGVDWGERWANCRCECCNPAWDMEEVA